MKILASANVYFIWDYSSTIDARNEVKLESFNLKYGAKMVYAREL